VPCGPLIGGVLIAACSYGSTSCPRAAKLKHAVREAARVQAAFDSVCLPCTLLHDPSLEDVCDTLRASSPEVDLLVITAHGGAEVSGGPIDEPMPLLVSRKTEKAGAATEPAAAPEAAAMDAATGALAAVSPPPASVPPPAPAPSARQLEAPCHEAVVAALRAATSDGLSVALLNFCHSMALGLKLSRAGAVPFVVAWRGRCEDRAAAAFAEGFAKALAYPMKVRRDSMVKQVCVCVCEATSRPDPT
jgi:hypothetical protein